MDKRVTCLNLGPATINKSNVYFRAVGGLKEIAWRKYVLNKSYIFFHLLAHNEPPISTLVSIVFLSFSAFVLSSFFFFF